MTHIGEYHTYWLQNVFTLKKDYQEVPIYDMVFGINTYNRAIGDNDFKLLLIQTTYQTVESTYNIELDKRFKIMSSYSFKGRRNNLIQELYPSNTNINHLETT